MDQENNWAKQEVEELIAILKAREILSLTEGKKSRSLDTFKVVADDLCSVGVYRTPEQVRAKLRTLRKQYFKASRSRNKNALRACAFFPLLHDLFTDAQKKRDAKEVQAELNQKHQRHPRHSMGSVIAANYHHSRSSTVRSVSGSSISSMPSPQSFHNGYDHHQQPQHHQRHKYSATVPFGSNGDAGRRHASPVRVKPDKTTLKLSEFQPVLNNSLANLCKNERYADVLLFVCNDDDTIAIPAHRLVLGMFSSYFSNIFEKANILSFQTISIVLPPMITRAATHCLLQYMYTGEAIVSAEILEEVMVCGKLLRINGFYQRNGTNKSQQGLLSVPLVSVTKHLSMDPTVVSGQRKRKSTPSPRSRPTPSPTPSRSPTPAPAPVVARREKSPIQPAAAVPETPLPVPEKEVGTVRPREKTVTPIPAPQEPAKEAGDEQKDKQARTEDNKQTTNSEPMEKEIESHEKRSEKNAKPEKVLSVSTTIVPPRSEALQPESPLSMPPSPACSRTSRASPPCPLSPPTPAPISATVATTTQRKSPETSRSPPRDIIEQLDNMMTLTSDESMMEIVTTKSAGSRNSPFSTHTNSPIGANDENGSKLEALIEFDYDELNLPNSSMDDQPSVDLDNEDDHQQGTPLDQLVYSRLNCQLCYESFTTPTDWVQHVSGHCIMGQGLVKRRRISSNDGNSLDSAFRCDMCSSYFISAFDWQSHVAEAHEGV
uniref:Uncharacterized protein n=1 Tax=Anopheles atroparvus TaxID=41427 RepID=A0A182J612_ANOAO